MADLRPCTVNGKFAFFHTWGLGFVTMGKNTEMGSVGICELASGEVIKVSPEMIKFEGVKQTNVSVQRFPCPECGGVYDPVSGDVKHNVNCKL